VEKDLVQLSTFLKEGTKQTHNEAESNDFQRQLASAELSLDTYGKYLGQLYLVHDFLEHQLADNKMLNQVVTPDQFQAGYLQRDLTALGINANEVQPLQSTTEILFRMEQSQRKNPISLLGHHYVLFGSKHGGKYIAVQLRKAFNFDSAGCLYFDPYGTTFQSHWSDFRSAMDKLVTTSTVAELVLHSARDMFRYVGALGSELSTIGQDGQSSPDDAVRQANP
jgi:heme oxygenase